MNTTVDDDSHLLLALEQQRCQAMMNADFAHLRTLLHPDLVHIHAKGQVDDYASYFGSGGVKVDYRRVERSDLRVRLLGDTALMSGRQLLEAVRKDGTGTVHIDSQVLQVWTRGAEGCWQQLSFQTTPLSMRVE